MINICLTYLVNVLIVLMFFPFLVSVFQMAYPFSWEPIMQTMQIPDETTLYVIIAFTAPVIAAIIYLLPPVQWIQHMMMGVRKPTAEESAIVEPLMTILCERSGRSRDSLVLHMKTDAAMNAFATGLNHITVYTGIITMLSESALLGVLAHELGHLTNGDTYKRTIKNAMNTLGYLILQSIYLLLRVCSILLVIPIVGWVVLIFQIVFTIILKAVDYLLRIPTFLTDLFTGRREEYAADAYAVSIGLGRELMEGLIRLGYINGDIDIHKNGIILDLDSPGWKERFFRTHPKTKKRIDRIREGIEVYELQERLRENRLPQ